MQRVINHLIQLQELTLIREQEAFMGGEQLQQLDKSISDLTNQLPSDAKSLFIRLQKKDKVAVIPVSDGGCSTCGMKLPISMVQSVRAEKIIIHCPNCSRILYWTDTAPRSVAQKQSRTAPQKVGIDRFSAAELMIPRLAAKTRDEALEELASKTEEEGFSKHADRLVKAALKREAIISTGVDKGLAFPHVRGVQGGGLTVALGISPKGIKWGPQEKKASHIIFFVLIPTAANAFYLRLLAGLTETFMDKDAQAKLSAEENPVKLWKLLRRLTKKTIR